MIEKQLAKNKIILIIFLDKMIFSQKLSKLMC